MLKAIVLLLVAGLVSFTAPAYAVQTPLIDTGYQQQSDVFCSSGICDLVFPATTATVTEITNVSCIAVGLPAGTQFSYSRLYNPFGGTFAALQPFVFGGNSDGSFGVGLTATTKLFFAPQNTPIASFRFYTPESFPYAVQFACTLSGFTHS